MKTQTIEQSNIVTIECANAEDAKWIQDITNDAMRLRKSDSQLTPLYRSILAAALSRCLSVKSTVNS